VVAGAGNLTGGGKASYGMRVGKSSRYIYRLILEKTGKGTTKILEGHPETYGHLFSEVLGTVFSRVYPFGNIWRCVWGRS
jgi:hypothetical protein